MSRSLVRTAYTHTLLMNVGFWCVEKTKHENNHAAGGFIQTKNENKRPAKALWLGPRVLSPPSLPPPLPPSVLLCILHLPGGNSTRSTGVHSYPQREDATLNRPSRYSMICRIREIWQFRHRTNRNGTICQEGIAHHYLLSRLSPSPFRVLCDF